MKRHIIAGLLAFAALAAWQGASAQHTLGFTVGYGMGNGRFQRQQEMRAMWGMYSGGLSWRYYGTQRFVGGFAACQFDCAAGRLAAPCLHVPQPHARLPRGRRDLLL